MTYIIPNLLFKGFFIGLTLGIPSVPMNTLCIRYSVSYGLASGIATALGIAFADGFYSLIAGLSVTQFNNIISPNNIWLNIIAGIILIFLGIKTLIIKNKSNISCYKSNAISTFFQTALITLANPLTLAIFVATFATLGIIESTTTSHIKSLALALNLAFGVFLGSGFWFTSVSLSLSLLRSKLSNNILFIINKVSGVILIASGVFILISVLLK